MQIVSSENVGRKEVPQAKGMGYRREYIGSPGTINTGPQAFLVERNYPGLGSARTSTISISSRSSSPATVRWERRTRVP